MVSFDVSSLFTNVPLEFTIDLILEKVYKKKLVKTRLKREEMKELLEMCTKEMHFSFDGRIYQQTDGVCMGSPLGPVLANVFMVHLEETLAPKMIDSMPVWKRYVDDTFTAVKKGEIDDIIVKLNSFHPNIKFTHEFEAERSIAFLDVKIMRQEDGTVQTGVYRKPTNSNVYIHWDSYAPEQWKVGTLLGMIRRAYEICSNEHELTKELTLLTDVFTNINGYPKSLVERILKKVKAEKNEPVTETPSQETTDILEEETPNEQILMMKVPYAGEKGESLIRRLKTTFKHNLPENIKCRVVQTGTKISKNFNIKDKIDGQHLSNFIYKHVCENKKCTDSYIGETARRRIIRTEEHGGKDKDSWIYKHSSQTKHPKAKDRTFEILATNYADRRKRKLAEALFIRDERPSLNKQKDSYQLKLFA